MRKLMVLVTKDNSCLNDFLTAVTKCPGKSSSEKGSLCLRVPGGYGPQMDCGQEAQKAGWSHCILTQEAERA